MALLSTLTDDFATQDTTKWAFSHAIQGDSFIEFSSTQNTSVTSVALYEFDMALFEVETYDPPPGGFPSFDSIGMWDPPVSNAAYFAVRAHPAVPPRIVPYYRPLGSPGFINGGNLSYDPVAMRWLKIEQKSSTLEYSTSPDGIDWSLLWSVTGSVTVPTKVHINGNTMKLHTFNISVAPAQSVTYLKMWFD